MLTQARQHLQGFLLRHERIYHGPRAWTLACRRWPVAAGLSPLACRRWPVAAGLSPLAYRRWLTTVRFEHPAQQIVLQDYIHAVADAGPDATG